MKVCLQCSGQWSDEREVCPSDGSPLIKKDHDPILGTVIGGKYKIDCLIGKGAIGAVYKATKQPDGLEVAVKVLQNSLGENNEALVRFKREAEATSRLSHPHIVAGYDFGVTPNGQPFIVMDFIKGISLEQLLAQQGYLPFLQALPIIEQICQALEYAHTCGVIHRDIKPDNIVLEERVSQPYFVKVVDFGIAKLVNPSDDGAYIKLTRTGVICGSPAYISPEQIQGQSVDARSDIYALAVVIFEMLTGSIPFRANDLVKLLFMHATEPPPTLQQCQENVKFSPQLEAVIAKALTKTPSLRQESMRQLFDELKAAADSTEISKQECPAGQEVPPILANAGNLEKTGAFCEGSLQTPAEAVLPPPTRLNQAETTGTSGQFRIGPSQLVFALRNESFNKLKEQNIWLIAGASLLLFVCIIWVSSFISQPGNPAVLLNQGKVEEALLVLRQRKNLNKLSPQEMSILNRAYLAMAKKYAHRKQYTSALEMLRQISPKSSQYKEARKLQRRYRRLLSREG